MKIIDNVYGLFNSFNNYNLLTLSLNNNNGFTPQQLA